MFATLKLLCDSEYQHVDTETLKQRENSLLVIEIFTNHISIRETEDTFTYVTICM